MTEPLALEVIATSVADALAAEQGGAARVELVAALNLGGMTPSIALVEAVLAHVRIPVRVMVRQSEGHDVADPLMRQRLVDQARLIGQQAVDGLVFGALAEGQIDEPLLDAVAVASGRPITFHRAFEDLVDPATGLAVLARHPAVDRVLCDGGPGSWPERARRLSRWAAEASGRLQMLAGGGITDEALRALSEVPGLREVHVGRLVRQPTTVSGVVSADRVADLVARLRCLRA